MVGWFWDKVGLMLHRESQATSQGGGGSLPRGGER